jgi:predicted nucleic acid-binding protein
MAESPTLLIYLDTSVLGGYYDPGFLEESRSLIRLVRERRIESAISEMVMAEVARAPDPVRSLLDELIDLGSETLAVGEEAVELQEAYLRARVVGQRWEDDAMHVAVASIRRVDAIASWNFRHLVDPRRVRAFNGVNLARGYGLIEIRSPGEIVRTVEATE